MSFETPGHGSLSPFYIGLAVYFRIKPNIAMTFTAGPKRYLNHGCECKKPCIIVRASMMRLPFAYYILSEPFSEKMHLTFFEPYGKRRLVFVNSLRLEF